MNFQQPNDGKEEQDIFDRLRPLLQRASCPSADELGDFFLNHVAEERRQAVASHLDRCQFCQADLARLEQFLSEEAAAVPFEPTRAELLSSASVMPISEIDGTEQQFRGADEEVRQLSFSFGAGQHNGTIFMALRKEADGLNLRGELVVPFVYEAIVNGAVVEIWQEQRAVAVTLVDDGAFVCHVPRYAPFIFRLTAQDHIQLKHEVVV